MLSLSAVALSFAPAPLRAPQSVCRAGAVSMESAGDLKALADKCNPLVGFWDPMNLAEYDQVRAPSFSTTPADDFFLWSVRLLAATR